MQRLWLVLISVVVALLLSFGASYLMVVSQNPSAVAEPATDYGPVS